VSNVEGIGASSVPLLFLAGKGNQAGRRWHSQKKGRRVAVGAAPSPVSGSQSGECGLPGDVAGGRPGQLPNHGPGLC
jgi:hypothetical protein